MFIVGLTGSLGTGKTTVAHFLETLGAKVLDADRMVHQFLEPKGECFEPVVKEFGEGILTQGKIDRKKIASIVFQDAFKLGRLTGIIHPVVRERMNDQIDEYRKKKIEGVVVLNVPLLFEAVFDSIVDATMVVFTDEGKQLERVTEYLKLTREEALRRIKAQMPLQEKVRLADFIIDNNGTKQQTQKQVMEIWQKLQQKTNT